MSIFIGRCPRSDGGKNGFDDYPDSPIIEHELEGYAAGQVCPCCNKGKLYIGEARKAISFQGKAPIESERHRFATLRCNSCGHEYTAPRSSSIVKWQPSARSNIILQKLHGMPLYRLSKLQRAYNIPLAPSSMWQQVSDVWESGGMAIYQELCQIAANCDDFYADDTGATILEVLADNKNLEDKKQARSCHTTVIGTRTPAGQHIVIYITANKYCSENLLALLKSRDRRKLKHYLRLMTDASHMTTAGLAKGLYASFEQQIMAFCDTVHWLSVGQSQLISSSSVLSLINTGLNSNLELEDFISYSPKVAISILIATLSSGDIIITMLRSIGGQLGNNCALAFYQKQISDKLINGNCLTHGRHKFKDVRDN